MTARTRQTLLIDADDTLWENNIYFERAIASFISFLNHREFAANEVRAVLNEVEHECIRNHGYGLRSFTYALVDTFERLSVEPLTPALRETIHGFARTIAEQPIEIMPGVAETLHYLGQRHQLILLTKGDRTEQSAKVERSGLQHHFPVVEIVEEKNPQNYSSVIERHRLNTHSTWMVGNSPKSDVNPALAVGLNAVFVPHSQTWVLEQDELAVPAPRRRLLTVERFAQLHLHF
jgi:putative hydrolase of the HAD superfamily